jgi:ATP-dependent Clp protease ATP-binding subunit ClpC
LSFVNFNIPVLVQNKRIEKRSTYAIRPLFASYPVVSNRRFEKVETDFKKAIRKSLNNYKLNRNNIDNLLWYLFNPEIQYKILKLTIPIGKQYVNGSFGVAVFELQKKLFICLPAFDNYIFFINKTRLNKTDLEQNTTNVITQLFRKLKNNTDDEFTPSAYFAESGEFITHISLSLNIQSGSFNFEKEQTPWYFSRIHDQDDFDGATEIEKVSENINSNYPGNLKRSYYREELVDQLFAIIYKKENTPIALIGPEGVGKNTVIHELVYRYLKEKEADLKNEVDQTEKEELYAKIWHLDPTRIITGMSIVGWWQKRFEAIIDFIISKKNGEHDKLLIDNIIAMIRIGKSASNNMTLSDVLKPYLEKRQLQLILAATPDEWKILQEKERRFSDLFQVIRLKEPDLKTASLMVLKQRKYLEVQQGCEFTIQAIDQLLHFQRNFLKRKALPGSVMRFMNQLAAKYRFQLIDAPEVKAEFETYSGLKENIFDATLVFEKDEIKKNIAHNLVGQPKAVDTLTDVVHIVKAKLNNPDRPLGSFLFIGPTGVGKTQAAKVLCNYLMGNEDRLIRFDMNEYIDDLAVQRLIGDYYNPEGQLTGKVRYNPFGIILFDEIEKANPKIHDLLLQVLDDGRLTDSLGRTVDFSNTIIIMTSNIGAREASKSLGYDTKSRDDSAIYQKAVENHFRPEFINRIDRIVIFNPLELKHILDIARLQIHDLLKRDGFVRRTTILNISKEALEWVAQRGFNAKMGGRALKRQIEKDLTTLSAEQLISTKSDQPIIFDILLKDNKLAPIITPLEFAEPLKKELLPELPEETKGKAFYNKLIRRINTIERKVRYLEESQEDNSDDVIVIGNEKGEDLNWQYYDFKEKIADIKQKITNLSLGFRDRYFKEKPAIPLRLKANSLYPRNESWGASKAVRLNIQDRLFQQEAIKEINENYQYASSNFTSLESEFIDSYLNVTFLEFFSNGFLKGRTDKIKLSLESSITGLGDMQIEYLINLYSKALKDLDIQFQVSKDKKSITAEGHSIFDIFKNEHGIHLFYLSHQNPLPIRLNVKHEGNLKSKPVRTKVIRIYNAPSTLTDLRSGFTNDANITPGEFKLLLYAGTLS